MIDDNKIFKALWEHRLHTHAPISKYFAVLTKDEINYLLNNGYMKMVEYNGTQHYQLTKQGWDEFELHTFGVWKYFEVRFLHLIGKVVAWFKEK